MSDLLKQIDAAAELGAKATKRPWRLADPNEYPWTMGTIGVNGESTITLLGDGGYGILSAPYHICTAGVSRDWPYLVAAANLDLAAVAAELRAKDAEIERLRAFVRRVLTHNPAMCECEGLGPRDCLDMIIQDAKALAPAPAEGGSNA